MNFYPRPPRGGRLPAHAPAVCFAVFLSTPSARRATGFASDNAEFRENFYPRPPRGGRPVATSAPALILHFYPRPPRGGRHHDCRLAMGVVEISIHALREEGDSVTSNCVQRAQRFLSTPSARRATTFETRHLRGFCHFYPRPPRGGRLQMTSVQDMTFVFLSTPSARRAT